MSEEITFNADCEVCRRKDTPCRNHHLVPQRLLRILPVSWTKRWEFQKVRICNSCNSYFHPEEHLYFKIKWMENKIKELEAEINKLKAI